MKLIVGLGNPGRKYANTRHNVGWLVLNYLKQKNSNFNLQITNPNFQDNKKLESDLLETDDLVLAKPQTFMNESGRAVKKLVNHLVIKQFSNRSEERRV